MKLGKKRFSYSIIEKLFEKQTDLNRHKYRDS